MLDAVRRDALEEPRQVGGVPLSDVLKLPALQNARVVAGAEGLGRLVRHVNVMEVPDILNWVKADELLLTTAYPLRGKRTALIDLVPRLAERGLAGLAVKPNRYIRKIPSAMLEEADRLAFPLLHLPLETSFDDVINSVLGVILNVQAVRLERSAAIHDRFTQIVLLGGGLRQIAQTLAESVSRPVAILDPRGAVLAAAGGVDRGSDLPERLPWSYLSSPEGLSRLRWTRLPSNGRSMAVRPIRVGGDLHGAVVVFAEEGELADEETEAVEHAAIVAALRLVQARAVAEADGRFQAVCLEELVTGHVADRAVLRERAAAFGWDLDVPRAALVADLDEVEGMPFAKLAGTDEEAGARRRVAEAARAALGKDGIIWERSNGIAALHAPEGKKPAGLKEVGNRLRAEFGRRQPGGSLSVGIGRVRGDPLELKHSYAEALRALAVARWARRPGQVSLFEDLGLDRLLVSCPEEELAAFCGATLGRLAEHDAVHRTQLVDTLDTYLACNGNAAEAARLLFVHYNTLQHRLERIQEILGPFAGDHERTLNLSLALRIRRMLPG